MNVAAPLILRSLILSGCMIGLLGCASSQREAGNFGYAATQPLRDFNISNPDIPDRLDALQNPFGQAGYGTCNALSHEILSLQTAIAENSRRYVGNRRSHDSRGGRMGNAWDVGVASATSYWIPFRGLIRQISGAAKKDAEAEAANARARYRVGYLIGQARAYRCPGF